MTRTLTALAPLLLLLPACGPDDGGSIYGDDADSTQITLSNGDGVDGNDDMSGDSGTTGDGDSGTTGDGDASTDDGVKLDVLGNDEGRMTAGDGGGGNGCQKVDFLFVIDNSGSMLEEQNNLAGSFPAFINSIESTLDDAQDYHVMVTDVDEWVWGGCQPLCLFPPLPGVCVGYECGVTQPMQCENVLGAGVTFPRGANASNMDCNFVNGKRFMTEAEPNLPLAFQCAARVGTDSTNDPERPMEAMVQAITGQGAVATCNEGFLRDDAILVVTFITDEDDDAGDGSAGTVETWRQALIDAKNGDESAIVVLGLFGDDDLPNAICNGGAEVSPRLRQFLDSWGDNGFFGSICADDYDNFFQSAVDIIDTTCDEFIPPE